MSDPDARGYWDHSDDRDDPWPPRECPDASPVAEDTPALLAFAAAIRGATWSAQLGAAMVAASDAQWSWKRGAAMALRLLLDEDAEPRMMSDATRDPLHPQPSRSEPSVEWREARARLGTTRADGAA